MKQNKQIIIENKIIGKNNPCFIIAEIGINHNGSLEIAKKLIDSAVEAGCDAVKFQAFTAKTLYPKSAGMLDWQDKDGKNYSYPIYDNVKSFEMPYSWVPKLQAYCRKKNIIFFSSICDEQSGDYFEKQKISLMKTTSYAITHIPLIEHLAKKNIPLIISTGGSTIEEIKQAYNTIIRYHDKIMILHCIIKYPAPLNIINMNVLKTLKKEFPKAIIGYSDHSAEPSDAPVAAIMLGAKVIEKHITLDKTMKGPDHFFALEPNELKKMVFDIRKTEKIIKQGGKVSVSKITLGSHEKKISKDEKYLRKFAYQYIFAAKNIPDGKIIEKSDLIILRPGKKNRGLEPKQFKKITSGNYVSLKNISKEDSITWKSLSLIIKNNNKKNKK
jgi:N-acetylneuraminate synthase